VGRPLLVQEGLIGDPIPINSNASRIRKQPSSREVESEGIAIYSVNRTSKEDRLKLRLYLAQRIQRIDLTFGATVLTGGPVKNVQAGEGKIVAKLTFVNDAVKVAFIDKDRAVLMQ
jgi:hypothetical protein